MMKELAISDAKAPKLIWRIGFALLVWLVSAVCFAYKAPLDAPYDEGDVILNAGPLAVVGLSSWFGNAHNVPPGAYYSAMALLIGTAALLIGAKRRKWFIPFALGYTVVIFVSFWGLYRFACYWNEHDG